MGSSMNEKARKSIILYIMLVIFVGLDIWMLYGKVNLQQKVNSLQASLSQTGRLMSDSEKLVQYIFPRNQ